MNEICFKNDIGGDDATFRKTMATDSVNQFRVNRGSSSNSMASKGEEHYLKF